MSDLSPAVFCLTVQDSTTHMYPVGRSGAENLSTNIEAPTVFLAVVLGLPGKNAVLGKSFTTEVGPTYFSTYVHFPVESTCG